MRKLLVTVILTMSSCFAWGGMEFGASTGQFRFEDLPPAISNDTQGAWCFWFMIDSSDPNFDNLIELRDSASRTTFMNFYLDWRAGEDRIQFQLQKDSTMQWHYKPAVGSLSSWVGDLIFWVVSHDGTEPTFYLNGEEYTAGSFVTTTDKTAWMKAICNDATAKVTSDCRIDGYNGKMYRTTYFPTALTAPEVRELYDSYANYRPNDGTNVIPPTADWIGARGYGDGQTIYDLKDWSGNENGGDNAGATFGREGDSSFADFDSASSEYISSTRIVNDVTSDTAGTFSMWCEVTTSAGNFPMVFSVSDGSDREGVSLFFVASDDATAPSGFALRIDDGGLLVANLHTTNWQASADTLYHVVAVVPGNGTKPSVYIDGVAESLLEKDGTPDYNIFFDNMAGIDVSRIGARNWNGTGNGNFYEGQIHRVQYFPTAFSASQVTNLFEAGENGYTAGATADWRFEDDSKIYDISGNGLHGYATNGVKQATVQTPKDEDTVVDYSGNGNDGTNEGATLSRAGDDWKAAFNGSSDYINCGTNASLNFSSNDSYSVSFWFSTTRDDGGQADICIERYDGTYLPYDIFVLNNLMRFAIYDGATYLTLDTTNTINDGALHHYVAVRSVADDKLYCYLDGALNNSVTDSTTADISAPTGETVLGARLSGGATLFWEGDIYRTQIFPTALTSNQISSLYSGTQPTNAVVLDYTMTPYATPTSIEKPRTRR